MLITFGVGVLAIVTLSVILFMIFTGSIAFPRAEEPSPLDRYMATVNAANIRVPPLLLTALIS